MPRSIANTPLPSGEQSPATTLRRSATMSGSGRSRPQFTPVRCQCASVAPQIQSAISATARAATNFRGFFRAIGPRYPGWQPKCASISSSVAKRRPWPSPGNLATLTWFMSWSPRNSSSQTWLLTEPSAAAAPPGGPKPALPLDGAIGSLCLVRAHDQRLDRALQGNAEPLGDFRTGALVGGGRLVQRPGGGATDAGRRQGFGLFHVRCVVALGAVDDRVLAGGGHHLELFAQVAADGAAVGSHRAVGQPKAVEDAAVGLLHHQVAGLGRRRVPVE